MEIAENAKALKLQRYKEQMQDLANKANHALAEYEQHLLTPEASQGKGIAAAQQQYEYYLDQIMVLEDLSGLQYNECFDLNTENAIRYNIDGIDLPEWLKDYEQIKAKRLQK